MRMILTCFSFSFFLSRSSFFDLLTVNQKRPVFTGRSMAKRNGRGRSFSLLRAYVLRVLICMFELALKGGTIRLCEGIISHRTYVCQEGETKFRGDLTIFGNAITIRALNGGISISSAISENIGCIYPNNGV